MPRLCQRDYDPAHVYTLTFAKGNEWIQRLEAG